MLAGKKMQLHTIIKVALRALMYRERFDNKTETFLKSYLNSYIHFDFSKVLVETRENEILWIHIMKLLQNLKTKSKKLWPH